MTCRKPGGMVLTTAECTAGCLKHLGIFFFSVILKIKKGFEYFTDGHWKR